MAHAIQNENKAGFSAQMDSSQVTIVEESMSVDDGTDDR